MPLISYISVPIEADSGNTQYVRVDLKNEKLLIKVDEIENEYHEVEDIKAMVNEIDMYMKIHDNHNNHDDEDCSCCHGH